MNEKTQKIYGGFTRLRNFPLDSTSIFDTMEDLVKYLIYNKTAYEGQLCVVRASDPQGGVYQITKDYNNGELGYLRLADDKNVIKNTEDIATLFKDLADKHSQIAINTQNIDALRTKLTNEYVTNSVLAEEINKILGDEYEGLSNNLNDIVELSHNITDLMAEIETKINSEEVLAVFREYTRRFAAIENDISIISSREEQDISNARERLNHIDEQIADILPRILNEDDVLEIVERRGLFNVIRTHDFTFTPSVNIDRSSGFVFHAGDTIRSIQVTMSIPSNTTGTFIPYMSNLDGTYNSSEDDIEKGTFVIEAGTNDGYVMDNIEYVVKKDGYISISTPSSFSQGKGTMHIEYFRQA